LLVTPRRSHGAASRYGTVMCFDSDSKDSKRLWYYGTDDQQCGEMVMRELAKLFAADALPWKGDAIKCVSVDALTDELPYLKSGQVHMLLAQDCYGWGEKSVQILVDKIVNQKDPARDRIIAPVTKTFGGVVLRDGRYVATLAQAESTPDRVVQQMMIGRPLAGYFPRHLSRQPGEVLLRVGEEHGAKRSTGHSERSEGSLPRQSHLRSRSFPSFRMTPSEPSSRHDLPLLAGNNWRVQSRSVRVSAASGP
jgi:hypothetical protein